MGRPCRLPARAAALAALAALFATLGGCEDRDRITPLSNGGGGGGGGEGEGPITTIRAPGIEDTTVAAGPAVFVAGQIRDETGLDSVYVDITGGVTRFPPVNEDGSITLSFALPITTDDQQGQVIVVTIYGVDLEGNRGDPARRTITVE